MVRVRGGVMTRGRRVETTCLSRWKVAKSQGMWTAPKSQKRRNAALAFLAFYPSETHFELLICRTIR